MSNYIVTVYQAADPKDKTADVKQKNKNKSIVCHTDKEMFEVVQNAMDGSLTYEVYKAELELVLGNREAPAK
jgi:hypothetical protein